MKALTVRQPHASLIALGIKTIETRSRYTSYRGRIAIHAGKAAPQQGAEVGEYFVDWGLHSDHPEGTGWLLRADDTDDFSAVYEPLPLGCVVATATLADCLPIVDHVRSDTDCILDPRHAELGLHLCLMSNRFGQCAEPQYSLDDQLPYGDFTPGHWASHGRFGWLLTDITPITPVPAKGQQGIWNWDEEDLK